jgi:hypothetical protein
LDGRISDVVHAATPDQVSRRQAHLREERRAEVEAWQPTEVADLYEDF